MDDSDFATSHPIVRSLIENGEVTSTANGGGPGKQGTGAGGVGISRSVDFRESVRKNAMGQK